MTWVKENYDRFLLALAALVLIACAAVLFLQAHNFNEVFASLRDQVAHSTTIPAVSVEAINAENQKLKAPDTWKARMNQGGTGDRRIPLFISAPYIEKTEIDPAGGENKVTLVDPYDANTTNIIHPPVPNRWLIDNKQDLLSANALQDDTDGDGFNALDEYVGKTDPNDKDSHPPYLTKLFLKEFRRIPFRLLFAARNGETVLLNTLDGDDATQFLKKGDLVRGTKFKLTALKVATAKIDGIQKDTSVVTLTNTETGETIDLPKEKEVDSPTTYAVMTYVWTGKDFALKKGQEFTLKPEDAVKYRCTDLSATEVAVLKIDGNQSFKIGKIAPK